MDGGFKVKAGKSSKLGALFAQDSQWKTAGNTSLRYSSTPPVNTAAAPSKAPDDSNAPTKVIHAAAVNLIQYDASRKGTNLGTRGLAIIFTAATRLYHMVCYEPQTQKQECAAALNENFNLTVLPGGGRFCAFYDDAQSYWAINFADDAQVETVCQHVAMVKNAHISLWASSSPIASQLQQIDIVPSPADQKGVGKGDFAKVKYTMYLCSAEYPKGLGTVVGSVGHDKPKPIKVGGGKELKGIDQGLLGMSKGGVRFLILPPNLGYGNSEAGSIPANSTLLITMTVTNVKYKEEGKKKKKDSEEQPPQPQPVAEPTPTPEPEVPVDSDKEALANRMANLSAAAGGMAGMAMGAAMGGRERGQSVDTQQYTPSPSNQHPAQPNQPPQGQQGQQGQQGMGQGMPPAQGMPQGMQAPHLPQQMQQGQPPVGVQGHYPSGIPGGPHYDPHHHPYDPHHHHPYGYPPHQAQDYRNHPYGHPQHLYGAPYGAPPNGYPPATDANKDKNAGELVDSRSAPATLGQSGVLDGKHGQMLENLAKRVDQMHTALLGSGSIGFADDDDDTLAGRNMSGYDVIRALTAMSKERERMKTILETKSTKMAELQSSLNRVKESNERMIEDNRHNMEKRYDSFQEDVKSRQQHIMELQREKQELINQLNAKTQALSESEFKLQMTQQEIDGKTDDADKIEELKSKVVGLNAELAGSKAFVMDLEHRLKSEAESEMTKVRAETESIVAELQSANKELSEQLNAAQQAQAGLQEQLDSALSNSVDKEELAKLQQEIDRLKAIEKEKDEKVAKLSDEVSQKAAEIAKQTEEIAALAASGGDAATEQFTKGREEGREAGREEGREEGKAKAQQELDEALQRHKDEIEPLRAQLTELQEEKDDIVATSKQMISKLRKDLKAEKANAAASAGPAPMDILMEVYSTMEGVLPDDEGTTYPGTQVLKILKGAIKRVNKWVAEQGTEEVKEPADE